MHCILYNYIFGCQSGNTYFEASYNHKYSMLKIPNFMAFMFVCVTEKVQFILFQNTKEVNCIMINDTQQFETVWS